MGVGEKNISKKRAGTTSREKNNFKEKEIVAELHVTNCKVHRQDKEIIKEVYKQTVNKNK